MKLKFIALIFPKQKTAFRLRNTIINMITFNHKPFPKLCTFDETWR